MGPRSDSPGYAGPGRHQRRHRRLASMGPRSENRGYRGVYWEKTLRKKRFNGSTVREPWLSAHGAANVPVLDPRLPWAWPRMAQTESTSLDGQEMTRTRNTKQDLAPMFRQAFEALTGNLPLSWQDRLFREHFANHQTPSVIDFPTGLGKTMVMPIWLIARAMADSTLPRRLIYIVDRRTVVDQATDLAEDFAFLLRARTQRNPKRLPGPNRSLLNGSASSRIPCAVFVMDWESQIPTSPSQPFAANSPTTATGPAILPAPRSSSARWI